MALGRGLFRSSFLSLILCTFVLSASAETVFESADGSAGSSGVSITDDGWLFHNFEVIEPTQLGEVGAFFRTFDPAQVFGAIVALSGQSDFPNSIDLMSSDVLGTTLIDLPDTGFAGGEFTGELPVSLSPGWYALGFGTGAFGAASSPAFNVGVPSFSNDLATNALPYSQLQADHPTAPNSVVFQISTPRLVVKSAIASADFNGSGAIDSVDLQQWRDAYGTNDSADADSDGDSDGTDFLAWQQQYAPAPTELPINGEFETGSLEPWTPVVTPNGNVSLGFPRVESFDVDGDGSNSDAMRIRVGQVSFDSQTPAGGGIEQTFSLDAGGLFSVSADIASANLDFTGNSSPGRFDLLVNGSIVSTVDLNGQAILPGQVLRDTLSGSTVGLVAGQNTVEVRVTRTATNSREIYQYVDNIKLELVGGFAGAVPEPSSLTLSICVIGYAFGKRSRQQKQGV